VCVKGQGIAMAGKCAVPVQAEGQLTIGLREHLSFALHSVFRPSGVLYIAGVRDLPLPWKVTYRSKPYTHTDKYVVHDIRETVP